MKEFLHHLFLPRTSNNHRPKILHHQSLLFVISFLYLAGVLFSNIKQTYPTVLGISTNISIQELLSFTNQKRDEVEVSKVQISEELSKAAAEKAKDMFQNNYWAHNSPAGKTPWVFIEGAGYNYMFAGENLARGFTESKDVVEAWMNSKSHRENMLSSNYQDVGFAIQTGKLNGEETMLVVEMFGSKTIPPVVAQKEIPIEQDTLASAAEGQSSVQTFSLLNSFSLSKNLMFVILMVFISVFVLDMIIIERRKITRLVGHNLDHIFMLGSILLFVLLLKQGVIT